MGELQDGLSSGKLLHQLADKRCKNFNTCADEANTMSNVNKQLLQLFNVGQGQLQAGLCDDARETTAKVVDLMYVPMIQGTQRYAYKVEKLSGGEKEMAEGAVFAAAVLPRIFAEDEAAAQTIYDSMMLEPLQPTTRRLRRHSKVCTLHLESSVLMLEALWMMEQEITIRELSHAVMESVEEELLELSLDP